MAKMSCSKCGLVSEVGSHKRGSVYFERVNYPFGRRSRSRVTRTHVGCGGVFALRRATE